MKTLFKTVKRIVVLVFGVSLLSVGLLFLGWVGGITQRIDMGEDNIRQLLEEIKSLPTPLPTPIPTPQIVRKAGPSMVKWGGPELWDAINKRRVERGVNPLNKKDNLCTIAAIRLAELRELGKLDGHEGYGKLQERTDVKWIFESYGTVAEFLISGYSTPEETVAAWEHTLGHSSLLAGGEWSFGCVYAQGTFGVAITAY